MDAVLDPARASCAPARAGQVPGLENADPWPVLGLEWPGEGVGVDMAASESLTRLRRYEDGALDISETWCDPTEHITHAQDKNIHSYLLATNQGNLAVQRAHSRRDSGRRNVAC